MAATASCCSSLKSPGFMTFWDKNKTAKYLHASKKKPHTRSTNYLSSYLYLLINLLGKGSIRYYYTFILFKEMFKKISLLMPSLQLKEFLGVFSAVDNHIIFRFSLLEPARMIIEHY